MAFTRVGAGLKSSAGRKDATLKRAYRIIALTGALAVTLGFMPPAAAPSLVDAAARTLPPSHAVGEYHGVECMRPIASLASPIGFSGCPGIRPGGVVRSQVGGCTLNFLFRGIEPDGSHRLYIGTAGHCILENDGERSWAPGTGPSAHRANGSRFGEFAYAILNNRYDFALIRIDHNQAGVSQRMCHFGGPTRSNHDRLATPVVLHHVGNGMVFGDTVPARTGLTTSMGHPDYVWALTGAMFGDSGSPVISADGGAVGVLVAIGASVSNVSGTGVILVTRLGPQRQRAQQALGLSSLQLLTSSLA